MNISEKLITIAENEQKIYNKGYYNGSNDGYVYGYDEGYWVGEEVGYSDGYNEGHEEGYHQGEAVGFEQGKQAEYDAFWDEFQKNGAKISYVQAFYSSKWTAVNYKPKYPIICSSCTSMCNSSLIEDTIVPIDITTCTSTQYMLGYISTLITVRELKVSEITGFNDTFAGSKNIETIFFSGTIGKSLNMQEQTKLSVESVKSAINCLKDFTGTEYENTYKLTLATSVWTRIEETTPPNGYTSWRSYVESKGWLT